MAIEEPEVEEGIEDPIDQAEDQAPPLHAFTSPRAVDGVSHPSHARGVSVITPEIVSIFDFKPLFDIDGTVTPAGNLFEIQNNARRVRVNQMNELFSLLTKDPNKNYAKIIERLKVAMSEEMYKADEDCDDLLSLYNNFYTMLMSFDISAPWAMPTIQNIMQKVRNSRIQSLDSSLVYPNLLDVETFTDILEVNHRVPREGVNYENSSNTKLLYVIAWDLYWHMRNTTIKPQEIIDANRRAYPEDWGGGDSSRFRFMPRPGIGVPENYQGMSPVTIAPRVHESNFRLPFHPGRLGLSRHMMNTVHDDVEYGENLGYYSHDNVLATFKAGNIGSPAEDLYDAAFFLKYACKDMSLSSAHENPAYKEILVSKLRRSPERVQVIPAQELFKSSFPQFHTGEDSPLNALNYPASFSLDEAVQNDLTFARSIKREPENATASSRPTPLFDPLLHGISPAGTKIENMQILLRDKESLENVLENVSGLSSTAEAIEEVLSLSEPDLQPVGVFNKVLDAFSSALERLNPKPVSQPGGPAAGTHSGYYNDGDFLDFAILSECIKNVHREGKFKGDTDDIQTSVIPMIDLVNMLLYKLGRSSGFYSNVSLSPGSPIVLDSTDETVGAPNTKLLQNIESMIASYLVDGSSHWSEFYAKRNDDNIGDAERLIEGERYGGVYWQNAAFVHGQRPDLATTESRLSTISVDCGSDGYYNARNSNELFVQDDATAAAKLMDQAKVTRLLTELTSGARPSIFRDIVNILNDMNTAALSRGSYFLQNEHTDMNKMKNSLVDVSVIGSFVLQAFSKISHALTGITFNVAKYTADHPGRFVWLRTRADDYREVKFAEAMKEYKVHGIEYLYSNQGAQNFAASILADTIINNLRSEQKRIVDSVDLLKSIKLYADRNIDRYLQLFNSDNRASRILENLDENDGRLLTVSNPSQIALAKNKLKSLWERIIDEKYFDDFMMSTTPETAVLSTCINPEFTKGIADNLKIMTVGIPDGFSRIALGYDRKSADLAASRTKVTIRVYRHDIILNDTILDFTLGAQPGDARGDLVLKIKFKPQEFEFDMRTFFKDLSPLGEPADARVTQLDNEGNLLENPKTIDQRSYKDISDVIRNHMIFRKFRDDGQSSQIYFPFEGTEQERQRFKNHCFDYIAKTYVRAMTGLNLDEESFLIDKEKESIKINSDEALEFFELVQGYVNDKTNTETSLESYLAGSRSTRELLRRLKGMPPAEPLLDVIDVNDNDLPEELNEMLIQDIINFIKMINSHNLIFTASTDRQKLIEPKLFERIFCMFVDPDSFEIDGNMDGILKNKMIEAGLLNQEGTKLSETYSESGVPQFNQFYVEVV